MEQMNREATTTNLQVVTQVFHFAGGDVQSYQLPDSWLVNLSKGQSLDALILGHLFQLLDTHLCNMAKQEGAMHTITAICALTNWDLAL